MPRQHINIGTVANDGTGDSLRQAAQKINANLVELYLVLGLDSDYINTSVRLWGESILFDGLTQGDGNVTVLGVQNPTAIRSVVIPDASGTLVLDTMTQTVSNKKLASPKITGGLFDSSGNELLRVSPGLNPVNELTLSNAATGQSPKLAATGNDTNIGIELQTKGSGAILHRGKVAYQHEIITTSPAVVNVNLPLTIFNGASNISAVCSDGSTIGESKKFINDHVSSNATVTPVNFAQGTNFIVKPKGLCELVWSGSKWFLDQDSGNFITIT